ADRVDDPGNGHDLVAAHDERPRLSLRPGDLRVDEHVLDLLPTACQMVARTPPAYLKPLFLGCDRPLAPADRCVEGDRGAVEPRARRLGDDLAPVAEVEAARAVDRVEEVDEPRRRGPAVGEAEQVALGGRMETAQARQDLVADEAALRAG